MRFAFGLIASGTLALSGCGAPEFVNDRDAVLRIAMSEYRLEPENLRVGSHTVRIVARNDGRLTHNIKVLSLDREEGEPYEDFGGTETAQPGETVRATVRLPRDRTKFRLACTIANHDDLGQFGELQVDAK